jgi:alkylated DNA repair dioxygenase AlkB
MDAEHRQGLFSELDETDHAVVGRRISEANAEALAGVRGLELREEFVTGQQERCLMERVDQGHAADWLGDLQRRVQHFGYKYDYKTRRIDASMRVGRLPVWLRDLGARLVGDGVFAAPPDQMIVNEYVPGQGISAHVDCVPCFEGVIASLTLGSGCVMEFTRAEDDRRVPVYLKPRSLVVLRGEVRYDWRHAIPARKSDEFAGVTLRRSRRVSLTFRRVILGQDGAA